MILRVTNFSILIFIRSILFSFLLLLPLYSYAIERIYTVQTGSFITLEHAQKQFDSLIQRLDNKKLDNLRIEKINKYYSVRLGKFEDYAVAEKFLNAIKPLPSPAIIIKAYFIDERIVRLYKGPSSIKGHGIEEKPVITPPPYEARSGDIGKLLSEDRYDETIETYRKAINESQDNKEKSLLHKELGDLFVSRNDFKNAAEEFIKALSLYSGYSEEEKLQMAVYMSWGDRLDEAIAEIESILSDNPENSAARVHFAKVLSWSGRLNEAEEEADKVLRESPDNKDALLVKADALNWGGNFETAMPIYKNILDKGEDFDARVGLTYALLSSGDTKGAKESYRLLRPKYPHHEKELKKLNAAFKKRHFKIRYNYYNDTDDNRYNEYWIYYGFLAGNWNVKLNYRYTDAWDDTRDNDAHELFFNTYSKLTESIGAGVGMGVARTGDQERSDYFTWNLSADMDMLKGKVGASVSRDVFVETPQIIENRIRITNTGFYISQELTDRLSLYGGYNYKDYSDDNNAHDLQFVSRYNVYLENPRIAARYRFRYFDFDRQSGSGYFDPDDFVSHQIFASSYFEKKKFYTYIEPFIGLQSFRRNGEDNHDFISGGYGTFGWKFTNGVVFEINAEGGNFALEAATGFRYFLIGASLLLPF